VLSDKGGRHGDPKMKDKGYDFLAKWCGEAGLTCFLNAKRDGCQIVAHPNWKSFGLNDSRKYLKRRIVLSLPQYMSINRKRVFSKVLGHDC